MLLEDREKVLVLFSGGIDSTTLLYLAKKYFKEVYALSFDYGQRHRVELKYAKEIAKELKVKEHIVVEIPHYKLIKGSALLDESLEIPKEEYKDEPPVTTVPARNLVFLSIASSFADAYSIKTIGIGVHALDVPYPDCRPEFISAIESAINCSSLLTAREKVRVRVWAPFLGMTKKDIVKIGRELGIDYSKTYSCYMGTEPPCGECPTCKQREEALKA